MRRLTATTTGRVRYPYPASAEHLWRTDDLYDVVVVLDYNDAPARPGVAAAPSSCTGAAGLCPTAGCIALQRPHLLSPARAGSCRARPSRVSG